MGKPTFEQLPEMVFDILTRLQRIEQTLEELITKQSATTRADLPDKLMTIQEAAEFLHLSTSTIYGLVHRNAVPVNKGAKRLYFSQKDLTDWVKSGYKKTNGVIAEEAHTYTVKKPRKY